MPTTQIGSVSMRYGSAANINQYQNNLYDKELVLEVNTIEKEANSGEYEYTYKLYQIVAENGVNTKLEIPLSSNLIDYLNKNGAFIKGTSLDYSEGVFTTETKVEKDKESFTINNYFPINEDALAVESGNSNFILTLKTMSPSGSEEDKVIQCCDFNVTVDKYGRVKNIEAKPDSSIKNLDDAVKTSAQRARWSQLELTKNLEIGPTSKSDFNYANTYNFIINNNNVVDSAEEIFINFYALEDTENNNYYYLNENGYLYFDTQTATEPITSFLKTTAYKRNDSENIQDTTTVVIVPDGLFQYKCTEAGLILTKMDSRDSISTDSVYYGQNDVSAIKGNVDIWNVKNKGHEYQSPIYSDKKHFVGSSKYEFLKGANILKEDIVNDSISVNLDLRPGIYNMQVNYNIKIDFVKSSKIAETSVCTGTLKKGISVSEDRKTALSLGETNDSFCSTNYEGNIPVTSMVVTQMGNMGTTIQGVFAEIYCQLAWLKETRIDFDSVDVLFSGTIEMLSEMIY